MTSVYSAFEEELASWRRKYARRPDRELLRLCLLALEREELVSVGYRESIIAARLERMQVSAEARDLILKSLVWAWKDEEMHAIYIRGAIVRLGSTRLRTAAFLRQLAGAVGGWSSSVLQHARWRDAPLSRALAGLITWSGVLLGKVPGDVRKHIDYGPFREFCLFNVEAERTAWLCWSRIVELSEGMKGFPATQLEGFRRIVSDEERHRRLFEALADCLDEKDQLAPGISSEGLAERIAAIGEAFLPRSRRVRQAAGNPLGAGGPVWVAQGKAQDEKISLFGRLLEESRLEERLRERAHAIGKAVGDLRIAIKPTFMLGYDRRDRSIITDPVLLDELARFFRTRGAGDVVVVEARNIYDRFYRNRSVAEVATYFGYASASYRIVDASEEQVPHVYSRGMAQHTVSRTWKDADFRVSFSKMRSHPLELAHLGVGNVEWLGARCDEFVFVERQAHRETATSMLLDDFPPHFAIIDAYDLAADGLVGVMGCPRPPSPGRLYAGGDALAVDKVASRHMGIADPRESSLLRAAFHWFGVSAEPVEVIGPDEPIAGWRGPYHSDLSTLLSFLAFPVYVLGSFRGALFVPEMDRSAFPPLGREGFFLRLGRRLIQTLLGLRLPRPGPGNPGERDSS